MQLRRVLLLFAIVLGMSAVVASLAPPPEDDRERDPAPPALETPSASPQPAARTVRVRLKVAEGRDAATPTPTRALPAGSSAEIVVVVPEYGEVVVDGLGLREAAEPGSPARFELLAEPAESEHSVVFFGLDGEPRIVGRLEFVAPTRLRGERPSRPARDSARGR